MKLRFDLIYRFLDCKQVFLNMETDKLQVKSQMKVQAIWQQM